MLELFSTSRRAAIFVFQLAAILLLTTFARAAATTTESFTDDSTADFAQGDITTSTLTFDGFIAPPLERVKLSGIKANVVWDIAEARGTRYIATGHKGELFTQKGTEKAKVLADFKEPALYTVRQGHDGAIYVGASPKGFIYRVNDDGSTKTLATTGKLIVWDMIARPDGFIVATGTTGAVLHLKDDGTSKTLSTIGSVLNVLSIAAIPGSEDIAAATQGPGLIARISPDGTTRILVDPEQEEVRRVAVMKDGSILGAVNGVRSPGQKLLATAPDEGKAVGGQKPRPESFIVRVHPDGFAEEWWTSPESPIHDLFVRDDNSIIVAAGSAGNLYEITPGGDTNRIGIADEELVTRLAPAADGKILVGTGSEAAVYLLNPAKHATGVYESRVFDGKGSVRWGRVDATVAPAKGHLKILVRTGNTAKPDDKTWTRWSDAADFDKGDFTPPGTTIARFFQYRVQFEAAATEPDQPRVDTVRVFYARANQGPKFKSVTVAATAAPATAPKGAGTASFDLTWDVADANGDALQYSVYIRPVESAQWVLVEDELTAPKYTLDAKAFPDGEYRVKVIATDAKSNAAGAGVTSEHESGLFLIDNGQPKITIVSVERGSAVEVKIHFRAQDSGSLITAASWRVGAGDSNALLSDDGFFDQKSESFTVEVKDADAKKGNFVTLSATDENSNTVLEKVTLD
ncbi:hypothetical protein BH09SUM1_BH09SUM1_10820 [soil metagenome]